MDESAHPSASSGGSEDGRPDFAAVSNRAYKNSNPLWYRNIFQPDYRVIPWSTRR
jgi:hypothetical protein